MSYKFCLFLDGLDEYSGNHKDLIADLRLLSSHTCIKMCVSSRPWNVFVNAFSSLDTVLHLEELTAYDIYQYASGHLAPTGSRHRSPHIDDLVSEIVLKSQGVFFWVFLVTKSLEEGLSEGDSVKILQRRLAEMPSDLEEFFKSLLARLDKIYKSETSQVLKLAMVTLGRSILGGSGNNWLDFWLLRELGFYDCDFAAKMEFRSLYSQDLARMKSETRVFLNATCKDFLSVFNDGETVSFLHRSVHDFLSSATISDLIDAQVPPILRDPKVLLHIKIARCKVVQLDNPSGRKFCFGRAEPQYLLMGKTDDDYIFPGSRGLAEAFESVLTGLQGHCDNSLKRGLLEHCDKSLKRGRNRCEGDDFVCVLGDNWRDLFHFLVANGRYRTVLYVQNRHKNPLVHLSDVYDCLALARRFPQKVCASDREDTERQKSALAEWEAAWQARKNLDRSIPR